MADNNVQTIRTAYEAFARGDIPAVIELLDDNVEWEVADVLPQGGSFRGKAGAEEFFQGLGAAWEDLQLEIDDLLDASDHVVALGRAEGTLRETGPAGYGFAHVFTFTGGSVTRFREYAAPDIRLPDARRLP
jgi:ketosteroid isomerase-like protein